MMTDYERDLINNQIKILEKQIENISHNFDNPVAWVKMNNSGDLYDLRLQKNPYENNIFPLFLRPDHAEQRQQIVQSKG